MEERTDKQLEAAVPSGHQPSPFPASLHLFFPLFCKVIASELNIKGTVFSLKKKLKLRSLIGHPDSAGGPAGVF